MARFSMIIFALIVLAGCSATENLKLAQTTLPTEALVATQNAIENIHIRSVELVSNGHTAVYKVTGVKYDTKYTIEVDGNGDIRDIAKSQMGVDISEGAYCD